VSSTSLSRRAKFDLATLVISGVASSAFFLLGARDSRPSPAPPATTFVLASTDQPRAVPAPPPRPAIRAARAPKAAPAIVRVKASAKPQQSRLARILLGDGSETVQPFPLRQAER
jgi:hypothetical protein